MRRPYLASALRIAISLFLLTFLLWLMRENFARIWQLLRAIDTSLFALAFGLFLSGIIFMAWRLKVILELWQSSFRIGSLFSLTLIGYFFTNFLPTSIGGDLIKGYYISRQDKKRLSAYSSVFFDRVVGMFSVTLIASTSLVLMRKQIEHKFIIWTVAFLLFFCIIFVICIFYQKILKKIVQALQIERLLQMFKLQMLARRVYTALSIYSTHKQILLKIFVLSLIAQSISFFSIFLLSRSLAVDIPLGKIFLVMPVIFVLCMLPFTVNGLGVREWGFVLFFGSHIGEAQALALSLLYLGMYLLTSLLGGIIYLFWR